MKLTAYEGIVEDSQIKLVEPVELPEHARVDVVVAVIKPVSPIRMMSPRLARPEQADDFVMEVTEEPSDAGS